MSILKTIRTLEALEAHGVLDPKSAIERNGFERVVELIELYKKASAWGVPADHLKEIFGALEKVETKAQETTPSPSKKEEVAEPAPTPEKKDTPPDLGDYFAGSRVLHEQLRTLVLTGNLNISTLEICILFGVAPLQGNLRKITQTFDLHGIKGKLVADPSRVTRTRSRFYRINLDEWKTNEDFDNLWLFLKERASLEAHNTGEHHSMRLPIAFYDYLDGTELGLRFRNSDGDLSLVISNKTYNKFARDLRVILQRVYGENAPSGNMVDNTNLNRYLLARALRIAYPKTTLKEMVEATDLEDKEGAEMKIRANLEDTYVSLDLFDDTWSSVDTNLSGFVYILAQMFLDYMVEEESRLD